MHKPTPRRAKAHQPSTPATAGLDHGILNVPLSKRGDSLFGISRNELEAQHRTEREAAVQKRKDQKAQAKALLEQHQAAILARHGARFGERALRETLDSWAKWEPAKLIAFVSKFLSEQEACA